MTVPARSAQVAGCSVRSRSPRSPTAITAAGGPAVDKRRIQVAQPVKTIGAHQVIVSVHDDLTADVRVEVVKA